MAEGGDGKKLGPGFQGSERSRGDLIIYPQAGDPIIVAGGSDFPEVRMGGKRAYEPKSANSLLVSVSTSKSLGSASGTWSATIKPPSDPRMPNPLKQILDDDWVDIVFQRHGKKWHIMRGLIDEVRVNTAVGGSGATVRTYTLSGRDFGSIFERTQVWFNQYTAENVGGAVSLKVFGGEPNVFGDPTRVVYGFLFGFLSELGNLQRAVWKIPAGVPQVGGGTFVENVFLESMGFSGDPPRRAISPSYLMPQGNIWQLAQEWSDPAFCELYCDTTPLKYPPQKPDDESPIDQTIMRVFFRDRPFPVVDGSVSPNGMASPYFSLPLHAIPTQAIVSSNLGRTGHERFNAFFVSPQLIPDMAKISPESSQPMWSDDDILRHGMRRFDIQSHYSSIENDILLMSKSQRIRARDWYCINPYLLNGDIQLARGFPEIHIGERVRFVDQGSPKTDMTFYVEKVSHNWTFGGSIKTSLGITRGWIGDDPSYLSALGNLIGRYAEPPKSQPGSG